MALTDERLDEIERRLEGVTVGPWDVDGVASGHSRYEMDLWITAGDAGDQVCSMDGLARAGNEKMARGSGGADAWFIAHARTDVPELLAEVRRLRKIEEALQDARNWKRMQESVLLQRSAEKRRRWDVEEALNERTEARLLGASAEELERILEGKGIA